MENFNQAIKINPHNEKAYQNRGVLLMQLGEKQKGMKDLEQAAKLAQQQGNTTLYQKIQEAIRILQFS